MGLTDALELNCEVAPKLTDRLQLSASVFLNRVADALALSVTVLPKLTDAVLLAAMVRNQALQTAGEGEVIAPAAEISFM